MKISKVFLLAVLFLIFSNNLPAQTNLDEIKKAKEQAKKILQMVREEKWDKVYSRLALVVRGRGKTTIKKAKEIKKLENETREEISQLFKEFQPLDLEKTIKIKFDEKDKSIALINFADTNKKGFKLILIEKEWFYAMEIFVD